MHSWKVCRKEWIPFPFQKCVPLLQSIFCFTKYLKRQLCVPRALSNWSRGNDDTTGFHDTAPSTWMWFGCREKMVSRDYAERMLGA